MTKKELRKIYLERRNQISEEEKCALLQSMIDALDDLKLKDISTVHIYLPINKKSEINTFPIIHYLKMNNPEIRIVVPRTDFDTLELESVIYNEQTIISENDYGIPEPVNGNVIDAQEIDLVICPLIVFDKRGYRLGYGKGLYDRFLSKCKTDVIKIGLSYFEPVDEIEDVNEWDVKLDWGICPVGVLSF